MIKKVVDRTEKYTVGKFTVLLDECGYSTDYYVMYQGYSFEFMYGLCTDDVDAMNDKEFDESLISAVIQYMETSNAREEIIRDIALND